MLVLKRKEGQWVEITHTASGDKMRLRVCDIMGYGINERGYVNRGYLNIAFDDQPRNFDIQRPERKK